MNTGPFFAGVASALPSPPTGKGPFELSEPGVLERLIEQAEMKLTGSGEVSCPFEYASFEDFWRATSSAGSAQQVLRSVSEDRLKAALQDAVQPYQSGDGSIRMENKFRYVIAAP